MIEAMVTEGVPLDAITVLVATGLHRPNLGQELAELVGDPRCLPRCGSRTMMRHGRPRRSDGGGIGMRATGRRLTIGFLPGMEESGASPYVEIVFPTGLGSARNPLTARSCDVLILVGDSTGTLNELTIACAEARPVVILLGSGGWADRIGPVLHQGKYLDKRETVEIAFASTPEEAVDRTWALVIDTSRTAVPDRP
jgi:uncharacterized protein (TIGR00725 family)